MPVGFAPLPEEVSSHPDAATWLPVLVAGVESNGRWYVRCPHCGRPNHHGAEPGFRSSHCHCEGIQQRQIDGYVMAPPGATLAPYPDRCRSCRHLHTPVDLDPTECGRGIIARYTCDDLRWWYRRWRDRPYGPTEIDEPEVHVAVAGRRCALYRHFDDVGVLLYVGISERPVHRGRTHAETAAWVQYAARMEADWLPDRTAAETAEKLVIQSERPVFNKVHAPGDMQQRITRYLEMRASRAQQGGGNGAL